jgi:malate dehydrogenase
MGVWGNHSPTMYPDLFHAKVRGELAAGAVDDQAWIENEFLPGVGKRGAAIIEARGASSAASAANAAIDTVVSLTTPTPSDSCASVAVTSTGEYGVPEGLVFGLPIVADGVGSWSVKPGFTHSAFATDKIKVTTDELLAERDEVRALGLLG